MIGDTSSLIWSTSTLQTKEGNNFPFSKIHGIDYIQAKRIK
jgi:hypothetical protein